MTTYDEVAALRARLDALEAELATDRPTEPTVPPLGVADVILHALRQSEGTPRRPVRVSAEDFEALQTYTRNRMNVQFGDRTFTLLRDETAPPFLKALAEALADTP